MLLETETYRPAVVGRARERVASGFYDSPQVITLAVLPLLDVLAGDGEQARRDAFEMTVGDRWE